MTDEQLEAAGKLWANLQAYQCEAVLVLATRYPRDMVENFALMKWADLGSELQRDIAVEWHKLLQCQRTASR